MPQTITRTSTMFSFPQLPQINRTAHSIAQSEQMLHLIEPQISPSYRQSFTPIYPCLINTNNGSRRSGYTHNKSSQASSHRRSSVLSRKRDSEISQSSSSTLQDIQNRFSISGASKLHRPSAVTTN